MQTVRRPIVLDIIKQSNILFTHNAINKKTPIVFKDYFTLNETEHQHDTINNLNSVYSVPVGSLQLPTYRTNSWKSSIKYICSSTWNSTLKELSIKNLKNYNQDPFWISKTNIKTLKFLLKSHFLECYWAYVKIMKFILQEYSFPFTYLFSFL